MANQIADNSYTGTIKPFEPEEFRRQANLVIEFIINYYKKVENYPVRSQVEPGYLKRRVPVSAPHDPEPIEDILNDVHKDIIPGITHWQSPNFFGYFPCNFSTAGFLGEMMCTGFNIPGFDWISSPAATELESIVVDWVGEMLQLPNDFLFSGGGGGVMHGTTCEAILSTMVAARDKMLKKIGDDKINRLVVYCSDQTHVSIKKAAQITGIHRRNIRAIETVRANAFALTAEAFRETIESDNELGLVPLFLCATVGTTSSVTVDPLRQLCEVAKEFGIWVHVDAAYAGSACICPEYRHFLDGVEGSDSFSFNPHKWLFTGLDCCCLWVKDPTSLIKSLSTNPEYLRNKASESKQVVDYKDWQITLTRRFRSVKLWFVLRSYGVANLRKFIRSHVKMAHKFQGFVEMDKRFEVVVPRHFSTVCFRLSPLVCGGEEQVANDLSKKLLESINQSGKILMSHSVIGGIYVMRLSVGATLTEGRHVSFAWKLVKNQATALFFTI
ncbi:hypothetical protein ACS0TY_012188 [Phlomoides rotata]